MATRYYVAETLLVFDVARKFLIPHNNTEHPGKEIKEIVPGDIYHLRFVDWFFDLLSDLVHHSYR